MKRAAEGHLTTEALMWNQNLHQKTMSGMSSEDFRLVPVSHKEHTAIQCNISS
jgi:hypothetical protein